ncbi:unnamed protein product [Acanthosepion pharaonis]|uniref:Uncharacterized protein n=1 Tax=Acanthosepion pharaonis TaxID=158019 RepID=A0A812CNC2_ACAPH|nr:unnamed protein product [Sepia pharaonis]
MANICASLFPIIHSFYTFISFLLSHSSLFLCFTDSLISHFIFFLEPLLFYLLSPLDFLSFLFPFLCSFLSSFCHFYPPITLTITFSIAPFYDLIFIPFTLLCPCFVYFRHLPYTFHLFQRLLSSLLPSSSSFPSYLCNIQPLSSSISCSDCYLPYFLSSYYLSFQLTPFPSQYFKNNLLEALTPQISLSYILIKCSIHHFFSFFLFSLVYFSTTIHVLSPPPTSLNFFTSTHFSNCFLLSFKVFLFSFDILLTFLVLSLTPTFLLHLLPLSSELPLQSHFCQHIYKVSALAPVQVPIHAKSVSFFLFFLMAVLYTHLSLLLSTDVSSILLEDRE